MGLGRGGGGHGSGFRGGGATMGPGRRDGRMRKGGVPTPSHLCSARPAARRPRCHDQRHAQTLLPSPFPSIAQRTISRTLASPPGSTSVGLKGTVQHVFRERADMQEGGRGGRRHGLRHPSLRSDQTCRRRGRGHGLLLHVLDCEEAALRPAGDKVWSIGTRPHAAHYNALKKQAECGWFFVCGSEWGCVGLCGCAWGVGGARQE